MWNKNSFVFVVGGTYGVGKGLIECLLRNVSFCINSDITFCLESLIVSQIVPLFLHYVIRKRYFEFPVNGKILLMEEITRNTLTHLKMGTYYCQNTKQCSLLPRVSE